MKVLLLFVVGLVVVKEAPRTVFFLRSAMRPPAEPGTSTTQASSGTVAPTARSKTPGVRLPITGVIKSVEDTAAVLLGFSGGADSIVEDKPPGETSDGSHISSAARSIIFTLQRVVKVPTARNTTKIRLTQRLGAIEVYGSNVVVETDPHENVVYGLQSVGIWTVNLTEQTAEKPSLTSDEALSIAARAAGVDDTDLADHSWNRAARLILYADGAAPSLSYLVSFYVHSPSAEKPRAPHAIVDALNGQVLALWNGLEAAALNRITVGGVGGNSGSWGMQAYADLQVSADASRGLCAYATEDVQVQNMNGSTSASDSAPWAFDCGQAVNATFDSVNGGYSPLNDIVEHSQVTLRMYQAYLGTTPTDSRPLRARAHYGQGYGNAFWDGYQISVGDGNEVVYPLTSLDAIAHEYSHGFTQRHSGLQYTDQSGGINEAFSDMAGEAAKYFYYGTNDFIFGARIVKDGKGLRWLCNPPADGKSIDSAATYRRGMEPHRSSGVYNKAFCTLAKTAKWETDAAFITFAYANMVYWRQQTGFQEGACGVQSAASDLGLSVTDVAAAFSAVGVSC